jgi:hypothetical protein
MKKVKSYYQIYDNIKLQKPLLLVYFAKTQKINAKFSLKIHKKKQ